MSFGSMNQEDFVHLHVHTQYSLLEGAARVGDLTRRAAEWGMPAVAITDTNNLFGAIDFYFSAKKAGVKPIIGSEVLFAPGGRHSMIELVKGSSATRNVPKVFHLVLLCRNLKGYQNLCRLITSAFMDAPEIKKGEKPGHRNVIDREMLQKYSEGLICLTGFLRSHTAYQLIRGENEEAEAELLWLKEIFGEDLYLEIQDAGIPEQDAVNQALFDFGAKNGIEIVAGSDVHYLDEQHAEAHEILQCIELGRNLDFDRPKSLVPAEFYFKSAQVMHARLKHFPGACENTLKVAEKCNLEFQFKDENGKAIYHLPNFRPDGVPKEADFDMVVYFREQARAGLEARFQEPGFQEKIQAPDWSEKRKTYEERLRYEVDMIIDTGFPGYFLIVADFIQWAKNNQIPVGPGRGSGAGSLVAYSLMITDLDPIEFQLLFERFINPERISMPDFDVDFCQDRRGEVLEYVARKYGKENVSQIITFGKLQTRAVLKDVARVLGLSFAESDRITKLIPDELNIKLQDALDKEPRIQELIQEDPRIAKTLEYALALEGLYRNAGVHAAGVIITEKPIVNYCPLFVGKEGVTVTQFDKDFGEAIGLVKFDFLGLKTLTVIDNAVRLVQEHEDASFDLRQMSYHDQRVFDLIGSGDTNGVFQVESSGMKDLCLRLQPNSVEDLTAINALYRPGPLGSGMVDTFIECKHGRMPIEYELPELEPILKETYGVILYQEQVMQIARELAGYSLGQADMLRRAMGKKKAEEMDRHRENFCSGAQQKGILEKTAASIFELMAKFAEYGFNKSHSAAYAVLTYQTAYLKATYPAEFMAALMTTEMNNTDKLTKYIGDARAHQIPVLPPEVNHSERRFSVEKLPDGRKGVRFGLEAIKGVGGIAVDCIMEARQDQPFESVLDFCRRVPTRKVNKKVLESLTLAGAFDQIAESNRASIYSSIESLIEFATDEQEEKALGQSSLFDSFSSEEIKLVTPTDSIIRPQPDWPTAQMLMREKQVVGFYVSGHPMDAWQRICEDWLGWSIQKVRNYAEKAPPLKALEQSGGFSRPRRKTAKLAGLISEVKEIMTKKGKRMAFAQFEDLESHLELIFFPDSFLSLSDRLREAVAKAEPVIIEGEIEAKEESPKIFVSSIEWASEAHQGSVRQVTLQINPSTVTVDQMRELKKSLLKFRGNCPVQMEFETAAFKTQLQIPESFQVNGTPKLAAEVNRIFDAQVVHLR